MIYWSEDPRGSDISLPVEFLRVPDVGCNKKQNNPTPQWFKILAEAGFNQTFLAEIHSLMVCSFLPQTYWISAFVHVVPLD